MTSLRRHAQANCPDASYWLRRVLDDGRQAPRLGESVVKGVLPGAEPTMRHCPFRREMDSDFSSIRSQGYRWEFEIFSVAVLLSCFHLPSCSTAFERVSRQIYVNNVI